MKEVKVWTLCDKKAMFSSEPSCIFRRISAHRSIPSNQADWSWFRVTWIPKVNLSFCKSDQTCACVGAFTGSNRLVSMRSIDNTAERWKQGGFAACFQHPEMSTDPYGSEKHSVSHVSRQPMFGCRNSVLFRPYVLNSSVLFITSCPTEVF